MYALDAVAAALVADAVGEAAVGAVVWAAAAGDGDDFVYFGAPWVAGWECLVDAASTQPALVFFGEDFGADFVAAVSVGAAWVWALFGSH